MNLINAGKAPGVGPGEKVGVQKTIWWSDVVKGPGTKIVKPKPESKTKNKTESESESKIEIKPKIDPKLEHTLVPESETQGKFTPTPHGTR